MSSGTAARSATPAAAWIDRQAASWRNACSIAPLIAATSRACVTFVSARRNASRRSLQSIGGNHPSAATVLPIGEAGAGGFEIRSLTNASFPFYGGWGSGAVVAHKEPPRLHRPPSAVARSEEHTSELQSLMRISYAVFCLKKKNTTRQHQKST